MPTRTLTLEVEADFADAWLETDATASERTALLRFACALPREVRGLDAALVREAVEGVVADAVQGRETAEGARIAELVEEARVARHELETERARARTLSERIDERLQLAALKATDDARREKQVEVERLSARCTILSDDKIKAEQTFSAQVRDQLTEVVRLTNECSALRATVDELRTPAARGRTGEVVVADCLGDVGFDVEDTSMGAKKEAGYLDLLVRPRGHPDLRIAVECKNRDKIDPKADVQAFVDKARDGVAKGLFESAVFVSLRAHTKKDAPHVVEMVPNADGQPVVPVSFLGPERGKGAPPLTQDVLQSHMCMHAAFALECDRLHRLLATAASDDDTTARLRDLVGVLTSELQGTLDDMNTQSRLLVSLQASVQAVRLRVVHLFHRLCATNRGAPWLPRGHEPPWMAELCMVGDKLAAGVTDSAAWKNLSEPQKKRVRDHLGGQETFFKAAHAYKRARAEEVGTEPEAGAGTE